MPFGLAAPRSHDVRNACKLEGVCFEASWQVNYSLKARMFEHRTLFQLLERKASTE